MALCRAEVREYMNKDSPWEKYIIDSNTRYDTATPIPFFRRSWKLPNVGSQLLYLPDSNQSGSKQGKIKIVCLRIFVDSVTSSVRYRIPKKKEDWVSETRGSRWTSQWTRRNEICLEWMKMLQKRRRGRVGKLRRCDTGSSFRLRFRGRNYR